jgi:hypothetical protein
MTNEERKKFYRYCVGVFKPLFLVFCFFVTVRIIFLIATGNDESMSFSSIALGYGISAAGSLGLSLIVAFMGIHNERE